MNKVLSKVMLALIIFYKNAISPMLPAACRYYPTCSEYGIEAIRKYGPFKGGWLTLKRILSCNPWGGHGHDPVK
ncbi:MAG: membrane protein insertion efficiency factor YidD [Bacteroidetes bacterium]|nr:membrane protein insertion efficiency factor YidD [Bacteroidota bacterium]